MDPNPTMQDAEAEPAFDRSLPRQQKLEMLGALAAFIAHDLNNILAPILISVPMLRWGLPPEEFEKMLAGQQTAQQALDNAVKRGNDAIKQALGN